ncbi:MAG: hypothetical protein JWR69_3653 [Pedosphaera sp.]|jgi:hypothetical protein|nr:hypothetical protein [Pedosphaera sp.]
MYLIQILLPVLDNTGTPFPEDLLSEIRTELIDRFGGITAFVHSPAEGVWAHNDERVRDKIVLIEVMADILDRDWWGGYRRRLEMRLNQDAVLIHATHIEKL